MLDAVKKFAHRVLLLHAVLLVFVIAIVVMGAREVYQRAREHAIAETKQTQILLARQTAAGIEAYYLGIISQLEKVQRKDPPPPTTATATEPATTATSPPPATRPTTAPATQRARPNRPDPRIMLERTLPVDPALTSLMWRMLEGRVAFLFVLDPATQQVVPNQAFPRNEIPFMRQVAKDYSEFLQEIQTPIISRSLQLPDGRSGHLIAVPATGSGNMLDRTVVAFVPVTYVKAELFDPLNNNIRPGVAFNAALLDSSGDAMIWFNTDLTDHNVMTGITNPKTKTSIERSLFQGKSGAWVIDREIQSGDITLPPHILAAEPISLLDRQWTVLISSPIAHTEAIVRPIFNSAMFWSCFFAFSVVALLASTSFFMIRNRLKYERAQHDMLSRELARAREIQLAWLPAAHSNPENLDISAANLPANHISGDFYNWFELPPHPSTPPNPSRRIAIVIGDVTGHGMSAAFLMATTQLLVRNTMLHQQDPGRCLETVNKQLCTQSYRGQFVTMVILVLDLTTNHLEVATAGHPAPLVAHDGQFTPLAMEPQFVLGVDPDEQYNTQSFKIMPGSSVLLYTDGVIEAQRDTGEQYGLTRLLAALPPPPTAPITSPQQRINDIL
ncbi:MAG: serine/threonine-protein phosphatase, partial [Phycisphaerales bacterium]|nr:serine/threonine-protein phosphatase [Phycisphaerales bacterium]